MAMFFAHGAAPSDNPPCRSEQGGRGGERVRPHSPPVLVTSASDVDAPAQPAGLRGKAPSQKAACARGLVKRRRSLASISAENKS